MNPNNPLLMKNGMRLSDNLMNLVPGSFYKNKRVSKYRNSVTQACQLSARSSLSLSLVILVSAAWIDTAHSWR